MATCELDHPSDLFNNCEWREKFYTHHNAFQLLKSKKVHDCKFNIEKHHYLEKVFNVEKVGLFVRENPPPDDNDEVFLKKLVMFKGRFIRFASGRLRDDKEFILDLVKRKQVVYQYASERLRADRQVLEAALDFSECGNDLFAILERCEFSENHKHLGIVNLFKNWKRLFKFCTCNELCNDRKLRDLITYRENRQVIMQAAHYHGNILKFVDRKFSYDPELILEAVRTNPSIIQNLPPSHLKNTDFALKVAAKCSYYYCTAFYLNQDEEFWYKAVVEMKYFTIDCLPLRPYQNRELKRIVLSRKGFLLELFSDEDRDDIGLVISALTNVKHYKFVSKRLQSSEQVISAILALYSDRYLYGERNFNMFAEEEMKNNMEFMKRICLNRFSPLLFKDASPELRGNIEFIKCIINECITRKLKADSIREQVILNIIGKKQDREELIEISHQCQKEYPSQKLLFFACPYLFFDESFIRSETAQLFSNDEKCSGIEEIHTRAFLKQEVRVCAACALIEPSLYSTGGRYQFPPTFYHHMNERHVEIICNECISFTVPKYSSLTQETKHALDEIIYEKTRGASSSLEHISWDDLSDSELFKRLEIYVSQFTIPELSLKLVQKSFKKRFGNEIGFFKRFIDTSKKLQLLQFASEEIKDNLTFFLSFTHLPECIKYASERVRSNKDFVKTIIAKDCKMFQYASEEIRNDYEFVLEIFHLDQNRLRYSYPTKLEYSAVFHFASIQVKRKFFELQSELMNDIWLI